VSLVVFNTLGQEVRVLAEGQLQAGSHKVNWDVRDASGQAVATGTYLYQLSVGER
jgi:flagellar hook assembly protein FlgD